MNLHLVKKVEFWLPTWKGWICLVLLLFAFLAGALALAYPLLAPTKRVDADVLVVEGWLPDYALLAAVEEFKKHKYDWLVTSGGPLWDGHHASGFHSYAQLAAHVLTQEQFPTNQLIVAPGPKTWRHRTFHSAQAVHEQLAERNLPQRGIDVVTLGPHGRRTHLTFQTVSSNAYPVGIISLPSAEYEPNAWWKTSEGTKHIVTESLAATYEWLWASGREQ